MPRTRSLAWSELKIGIIAVFAIVMAAVLIFAVGGSGGFFWQRYPLKTRFEDVAGLKAGSPVRVAGVEVGSVTEVRFAGKAVEVWFEVSDEVRQLVTDQSLASLGSVSLLGESAVDIGARPDGTPVPDWGFVRSGLQEGSIASVTAEAAQGLRSVHLLMEDLRAGKGTIGQLFANDALYRDLDAFVRAAEQVAASINDGKGTLGRLANDRKAYDELSASLANLNGITAKIRSGEGSLGTLLNDPAMARSLTATTANMETLTGRLNLDDVAGRLQAGQGTAGQLLQDKQLYENMNTTVAELRGLVSDIRKDPKKYLNVKVSIF
jgi:phospholipid/cholesterol/gamma-HCH transport system substrate-binding protein